MEFIREQIKEKPLSKRKIVAKVVTAALCGIVFAIVVLIVLYLFMPEIPGGADTENTEVETETNHVDSTENTEAGIVIPPDLSLSISDYQTLQNELYGIGNAVNKSIVTIATVSDENNDWAENPFETEGQSSGFIVAEDDYYLYILTEKKVIAEAAHIRVSFVDNTGAEAKLFKYDGNTGIAILTVEKRLLNSGTKSTISVAKLGNSYGLENGSIVIALGSPLGTNYSISTGNITSVQNEIATQDKNYSVFTTDIVASENASGVLANTRGEIIGVVMQSFSGSQDMSTLTAVEIDEMKAIINILQNGKEVPYIGLYISTVTEDISKDYDLPIGVFIKDVASESPAMYAGLQSGDIIIKVNGEKVSTDEMFSDKVSQLIPGTTCEITVKRQNGDNYYDAICEVEIGVLK